MSIQMTVNGEVVTVEGDLRKRLVDYLREDLRLTSVKEGCSEGECGACTVLANGKAIPSCTTMVGQMEGYSITTVEGLEQNGELDPLQEAFIQYGAIQCGFCTPGMILSAKALLLENPKPSREEICRAIEGNLCRCTGYAKIVAAIQVAGNQKP